VIADLERRVASLAAEANLVRHSLQNLRERVEDTAGQYAATLKAQEFILHHAGEAQREVKHHLTSLVSHALRQVYGDTAYQFDIQFEVKRGNSEAEIVFIDEEGNVVSPGSSSGFGPVDVAAFALRISLWALSHPRPSGWFVMDEPFRCVDATAIQKVASVLVELAEGMGLHFIIVTHDEGLQALESVGIYRVSRARGKARVSVVELEQGESHADLLQDSADVERSGYPPSAVLPEGERGSQPVLRGGQSVLAATGKGQKPAPGGHRRGKRGTSAGPEAVSGKRQAQGCSEGPGGGPAEGDWSW
jgi:hypothetical protein